MNKLFSLGNLEQKVLFLGLRVSKSIGKKFEIEVEGFNSEKNIRNVGDVGVVYKRSEDRISEISEINASYGEQKVFNEIEKYKQSLLNY